MRLARLAPALTLRRAAAPRLLLPEPAAPVAAAGAGWLPTLGFTLLAGKALVDGAYAVPGLASAYFAALLGVFMFAASEPRGRRPVAGGRHDARHLGFVFVLLAYGCLELLGIWRTNLWGLGDALKRLSPFLLLLVLPLHQQRLLRHSLIAYALLVIGVNLATLPFGFAWTTWGSARTFIGVYFFKTDLAFGTVSALLILVLLLPQRRALLVGCGLAVGAMVALANARLNYLTYLVVVVYALAAGGLGWRGLLLAALCALGFGGLTFWIAQLGPQLSAYDLSDLGRFTQGRMRTWEMLLLELGSFYGPIDLLIGKGHSHDLLVALLHSPRAVYDSHNEVLSQLVNRGALGLAGYLLAWVAALRYAIGRFEFGPARAPFRRALLAACALLVLQGLTGVVSEYSTKTWPFLFCVLAVCLRFGGEDRGDAPEARPGPASREAGHAPLAA